MTADESAVRRAVVGTLATVRYLDERTLEERVDDALEDDVPADTVSEALADLESEGRVEHLQNRSGVWRLAGEE